MNPRSASVGPQKIGDFAVICWVRLDAQHTSTGKTRHYVGGKLQTEIAGLAIAKYPGDSEFYLLYCDAAWKPITDTCHSTIEQAKHQAEFEFSGVSSSWTANGAKESPNKPAPGQRP